jgi:dimethylamine corrinoid protein
MSDYEANRKTLIDAMVAYKIPGIISAVDDAIAAGMPATDIINAMGDGMTDVGVLFERGKLFLPHVLSAAAGMSKAMEKVNPLLEAQGGEANKKLGTVVMGTVEGDVHDIGKSICSTMLQCAGFEVHDLGRDVPKQKFVDEIRSGCNFCGMSALMTTTMTVMKEVIGMLQEAGLRENVVVMVGGAPITQSYCDKIGADVYGESAAETTSKAKVIANE